MCRKVDVLVHGSAKKKPRHPSPPVRDVAFLWGSDTNATSYVLQVGPSTTAFTRFNADVGNVVTATLSLSTGHYYMRVVPYQTSTALTPTDFSTVTV